MNPAPPVTRTRLTSPSFLKFVMPALFMSVMPATFMSVMPALFMFVMPAQAGIQCLCRERRWIPAFAGMTVIFFIQLEKIPHRIQHARTPPVPRRFPEPHGWHVEELVQQRARERVDGLSL